MSGYIIPILLKHWLTFYCFRTIYEVGRPSCKSVGIESIPELRALNYNWTKIASMLDISRATLYRRLGEAGISTDDKTINWSAARSPNLFNQTRPSKWWWGTN